MMLLQGQKFLNGLRVLYLHKRHKRLKPIYTKVNDFCTTSVENETDVLFFMLRDRLHNINDLHWKPVENLWLNEIFLIPLFLQNNA